MLLYMDISQDLQHLGLTEQQSRVYMATLQLGIDTVLSITKQSGLKRPTVYLVLDELEQQGLVTRLKREKVMTFQAVEPQVLVKKAEDQMRQAKQLLPTLNAIHNSNPDKPNIKIAEGISGVRQIYKDIFRYLSVHPEEELLIYGSLKDASTYFETQVVDFFQESMGRSKNIVREIGNDDAETRRYYRKASILNPRHEIRLIRNEGVFSKTDNMLYGNTLVMFSVQEQIFATTITSEHITTTHRALFNMAWRSGKPI